MAPQINMCTCIYLTGKRTRTERPASMYRGENQKAIRTRFQKYGCSVCRLLALRTPETLRQGHNPGGYGRGQSGRSGHLHRKARATKTNMPVHSEYEAKLLNSLGRRLTATAARPFQLICTKMRLALEHPGFLLRLV